MQAAFITGYGGAEVMSFGALPDAVPTEGQALIEVHAAGVNPVELSMREGRFQKALPYSFPQVTGLDISGVVVRAPEGSGFRPGDEVDEGAIRAFVSQVYPLDRLPEAYAVMETGRTRGKIVVDVRARS